MLEDSCCLASYRFFFPFTSLLWFARLLVRFYLLVLCGDLMEMPILKLNFKTIKDSIPNTIQGGEKKNTKPKKDTQIHL